MYIHIMRGLGDHFLFVLKIVIMRPNVQLTNDIFTQWYVAVLYRALPERFLVVHKLVRALRALGRVISIKTIIAGSDRANTKRLQRLLRNITVSATAALCSRVLLVDVA